MFILYTVAPILYRMASSAYYNLSLLSSDFYGLLFGLFLYVRTAVAAFHSASEMNARAGLADAIHLSSLSPLALTALHRLLAVLRRLRRGHLRPRHLFLARDPYVSIPAPLAVGEAELTFNLPAEDQGKIDPRAPEYVHAREGPNVVVGQV